jgi:hypothetical protein
MIEKLLSMMHDPDYRVRLMMARKIGFLFQMWDGHNELFHDIRFILFQLHILLRCICFNYLDYGLIFLSFRLVQFQFWSGLGEIL